MRTMLIGLALLATIISASSVREQAIARQCTANGEPRPACLMSHKHLPHLPADKLFPHLDKFKSKAAAEKAAIATSATVEAFGSVWLFTIERAGWRSKEGKHISSIGQLPIKPASSYSAEYLRPIFRPGTNAPLHIHAA